MPATAPLPQLTLKAIVLGLTLSMVLAGANAYLGLFAGMTVSASIPAAVISMAILKLFGDCNIIENNVVQTAASAGESLAAGVIFALPALNSVGYIVGLNIAVLVFLGGAISWYVAVPIYSSLFLDSDPSLAAQFAAGASGNPDVLAIAAELPAIVGFLLIAGLVAYLYRVATRD